MEKAKKDTKENIFTPKRNVRFFVVNFVGFAVMCAIFWPILDMLWSKLDGSTYTWTVSNGIIEPIVFSLIFTIIEFVAWNFFHPEKEKK